MRIGVTRSWETLGMLVTWHVRGSVMLAFMVAALTSGCAAPSVLFKAAGTFDDSDDLLEGYVTVGAGLTGSITLVNTKSGVRCTGLSKATYKPPYTNVGTTGKASVQCDDGRRVAVDWIHTTEAGGGGTGVDQYGHRMTIRFSMDEREVEAFIAGVRRHAHKTRPSAAPTAAPSGTPEAKLVATGASISVSADGYVLTAGHMIEGCSRVAVRAGESTTNTQVLAVDAVNDLALLKGLSRGGSYGTFRVVPSVAPGEAILVVGYPLTGLLGQEATVTTGVVSALAGPRNDTRFLQMTAPIQPGNSGGPVLDEGEHINTYQSDLRKNQLC